MQVKLPDMELIVNLGDWPLNKRDRQPPFPVFSWCGSENTRDIIWPTWDLMKATIMGMDRWVGHGWVRHGQVGGATHCNKGSKILSGSLKLSLLQRESENETCSMFFPAQVHFVYVCVGGRVRCQVEP